MPDLPWPDATIPGLHRVRRSMTGEEIVMRTHRGTWHDERGLDFAPVEMPMWATYLGPCPPEQTPHVPCMTCGRLTPLHLLDAKPWRLAGPIVNADEWLTELQTALARNEDCDWLDCEACYGPGWNEGGQ